MQNNHFLLLEIFKNTESAQLCRRPGLLKLKESPPLVCVLPILYIITLHMFSLYMFIYAVPI